MLDNMNPKHWGKTYWDFIYIVGISYPNEPTDIDKLKIRQFLNLLTYLLPCQNCKDNYEKNMIKYPVTSITVSSKNELLKWIIQIHNEVNTEQDKSLVTMDQILYRYTFDDSNNYSKNVTYVLLFLLCIVIIFWMVMFVVYK